MSHLRGAPAGPRQAVVLTVTGTALGQHASVVEGAPVLLLLLQALRALPCVADGPHSAVEFPGDILDQRFIAIHLDVLAQLFTDAQLTGQPVHDGVVGQGFEQGFDHLIPPLQ